MSQLTSKYLRLTFEVFGKVQGVFFRKYTVQEANKHGLFGWVMNTEKGTVVGVVEGDATKVGQMSEWLSKTGSPKSRIDKLESKVDEIEISDFRFKSFRQIKDLKEVAEEMKGIGKS